MSPTLTALALVGLASKEPAETFIVGIVIGAIAGVILGFKLRPTYETETGNLSDALTAPYEQNKRLKEQALEHESERMVMRYRIDVHRLSRNAVQKALFLVLCETGFTKRQGKHLRAQFKRKSKQAVKRRSEDISDEYDDPEDDRAIDAMDAFDDLRLTEVE